MSPLNILTNSSAAEAKSAGCFWASQDGPSSAAKRPAGCRPNHTAKVDGNVDTTLQTHAEHQRSSSGDGRAWLGGGSQSDLAKRGQRRPWPVHWMRRPHLTQHAGIPANRVVENLQRVGGPLGIHDRDLTWAGRGRRSPNNKNANARDKRPKICIRRRMAATPPTRTGLNEAGDAPLRSCT